MKIWILCVSQSVLLFTLSISSQASSDFVTGSRIKVVSEVNRATDGNKEMVVFREGVANGQPKVEKVTLQIINEFKPQPRDEYKLSDPIYKWDGREGSVTDDGKGEQQAEFTTSTQSWGKKFKIYGEIVYEDISTDSKDLEKLSNQEGPAKADIDALTPVVKIKSVTFCHGGDDSSLPLASDEQGKAVVTPEYHDGGGQKETAILYSVESTPVLNVCFDVKPEGIKMKDVKIRGESHPESVLKGLTMEKKDIHSFDGKSQIPFKAVKLGKQIAMGPLSHSFSISCYEVALEKKPEYTVNTAYVLLGQPTGNWTKKSLWPKVLQFVIQECNTLGVDKPHDVVCQIRQRLGKEKYGRKGTVIPNAATKTVFLTQYMNGACLTTNCSDVAGLLSLLASVHGVDLAMHVCYPFTDSVYHAYNMLGGKIYDVRFPQGDGTLLEKDFYDQAGLANPPGHVVTLDTTVLVKLDNFPELVEVPEGKPFKWSIPFDYIRKQTRATSTMPIKLDIEPGKRYTVVDGKSCFFLENYDVHNLIIK